MSKWKSRQDQNSGEIVSALRAAGACVRHIDGAMGIGGVPDLLVGYAGVTWLLEVKGPRGRLNPDQETFRRDWLGKGGPVATVRTVAEALAAVGIAATVAA